VRADLQAARKPSFESSFISSLISSKTDPTMSIRSNSPNFGFSHTAGAIPLRGNASPRTARSPLQDLLEEKGYNYAQRGSSSALELTPGGTSHEKNLIENGTAFRDISAFCTIELTGKDALIFLDRLTTNNLLDLEVGKCRRTIFCNDRGGIIDSVLVVTETDRILLFGSVNCSEKLTRWINRYIAKDEVTVTDVTGTIGALEVYGPQAESATILISGIIDEEPERVYFFEFEEMVFSLLKYRFAGKIDRYLIYGSETAIKKLTNFVLEYQGPFSLGFVGEEAITELNIKSVVPGAAEIVDIFHPFEIELTDEVASGKKNFIGRDTLLRPEFFERVQRKFVPLEVVSGEFLSSALPADFNGAPTILGEEPAALGGAPAAFKGAPAILGEEPAALGGAPGSASDSGSTKESRGDGLHRLPALPVFLTDEEGKEVGVLTTVSSISHNGSRAAVGVVKQTHMTPGKKLFFEKGEVIVKEFPLLKDQAL